MSPKFTRPTGLRGLALRAKVAFMALSGAALPPWDDYWYERPGYDASSGTNVSPESAMRLSAVFACVRVKSETLGSSPCVIFRQKPNGDRERATDHPLYSGLPRSPERLADADRVHRNDAGAPRPARQRVREDCSRSARRDRPAHPAASRPGHRLPPSERPPLKTPGAIAILRPRSSTVHPGRDVPPARPLR